MDYSFKYSAPDILKKFCVAGINYEKAGALERGSFAVDENNYKLILCKAGEIGLDSAFILSTCNRTEMYGYCEDIYQLVELLTSHAAGSKQNFLRNGYLKTGKEALNHLFQVASGLNSQILGDNEIQGQLKRAVSFARENNFIGPIMDRTLGYVFQASKKIRSETDISNGTASVSYAVVEMLRNTPGISNMNILVIGTGKMGKSVCKNLKSHLSPKTVTVANRTDRHAFQLANELDMNYAGYGQLPDALKSSEVIIVCTNSPKPIIFAHHIHKRTCLVFDLSVPVNVDQTVNQLSDIELIGIDQISRRVVDKTISSRKTEMPRALEIIEQHSDKFYDWLSGYRDSLKIKMWKNKLIQLSLLTPVHTFGEEGVKFSSEEIQKTVNKLAVKLRTGQRDGCIFIDTINEYLKQRSA